MSRIIIAISIFSFLNSCMGNKKLVYINQCREKLFETNEKFYFTTPIELKENLGSQDYLYYIGTDSDFHYFIYYTLKPIKTGMSFKINVNKFTPNTQIVFKESNTWEDGYKVSVSDL